MDIAKQRFEILHSARLQSQGGQVTTRSRAQLTLPLTSSSRQQKEPNNVAIEAIADEVSVDDKVEETSGVGLVSDTSSRLVTNIIKLKETEQTYLNGMIKKKQVHFALLKPSNAADSELSLLEMMASFEKALDDLFSETLKDVGDEDFVMVVLNTPALSHPISTKLVRKKKFSVEFVLAVVQDRAQSSFDLRIGEGIQVDVIVVKKYSPDAVDDLGGCRRGWRKDKKRVVRPQYSQN